MSKTPGRYDWADVVHASKKPWRSRTFTLVLAPRDMSSKRLAQIIAQQLQAGDVVIGVAREEYIAGFEGQPQFAAMPQAKVDEYLAKVAGASIPHTLSSISYARRDEVHVVEKLKPKDVVAVRGSWQYTFHTQPLYYALANLQIPYQLVSPFCDESEAKAYAKSHGSSAPKLGEGAEADILRQAADVAKQSFDYTFQTGCVLAKTTDNGYLPVLSGFNEVVPYQTYAMHHGNSRETNFSTPNDTNHYDTIHAEMNMLVKAVESGVQLADRALFINMLPCPNCARTLCQTGLTEIVYRLDHSDGYAAKLFEASGIKVRRIISQEEI